MLGLWESMSSILGIYDSQECNVGLVFAWDDSMSLYYIVEYYGKDI